MRGRVQRSMLFAAAGVAFMLAGCSEPPPPEDKSALEDGETASAIPEALKTAVSEQTQTVCDTSATLTEKINQFLDMPSVDSLKATRDSWRLAHETYQELAALYHIAELPLPHQFNDRDPVDAYPMLPGYLDQVPNYPRSGLTFSEVPLTPQFLREEHQSTDFFYLTLGFHPLESLLWPQGSRPAEATLSNFKPSNPAPEPDKIDAPQRRRDLLRLIAAGLKRDTQPLCQPQNQAYLVTSLAELHETPSKAAVRLEQTLAETIGSALARWHKHPEGEDRNGMPVAHSPQARSDFAEYGAVVGYLKNTWLPILLENEEDARENAEQSLDALAKKLAALDQNQKPIDKAALNEARDALTQFSEGLTELAFRGQAAEY